MTTRVGNEVVQTFRTRFTGGIDRSTSPEMISSESLTTATNAEYDATGSIGKADGIVPVFTSDVISAQTYFNGYTIYNNSQNLYRVDLTAVTAAATLIGTLEGTNLNKQSFCMRDADLLIASGGQLQKLTPAWVLSTDTNSPYCDKVFIDNGRVMVTLTTDAGGTDSDYRYWAAITDDTSWDLSPLPEAKWAATTDYTTDGLFQEIGYRDGLDIIDVQQLGSDFIFTKSNGTVFKQYRATGFLDTWQVQDLKPSLSVYDAVGAINDIYTIGPTGLHSFLTVQQYGDIKRDETGRKVNKELVMSVDSNAKIWHLPLKKQIALKIKNDKTLWLFHYNQRNAQTGEIGAWTKRVLTGEVYDLWESNNIAYIAMGTKMCRFDAEVATQDGAEFICKLAGQTLRAQIQFQTTYHQAALENRVGGTGQLILGSLNRPLTYTSSDDIAADDTDIAADDVDIAAGDPFYNFKEWAVSPVMDEFTPTLTFNTGSCNVRKFEVQYAEV